MVYKRYEELTERHLAQKLEKKSRGGKPGWCPPRDWGFLCCRNDAMQILWWLVRGDRADTSGHHNSLPIHRSHVDTGTSAIRSRNHCYLGPPSAAADERRVRAQTWQYWIEEEGDVKPSVCPDQRKLQAKPSHGHGHFDPRGPLAFCLSYFACALSSHDQPAYWSL